MPTQVQHATAASDTEDHPALGEKHLDVAGVGFCKRVARR
jgi:hypothetical protein